MQQGTADQEIRERATLRVKQKRDFFAHVVIYFAVNAVLAFIWWMTGGGYPWFLWPMGIWGIFVVANGIQVALMPEGGAGFERQVDAEVERMTRAGTP
jgi:hypothetical protein